MLVVCEFEDFEGLDDGMKNWRSDNTPEKQRRMRKHKEMNL